ncbi:unnamed protein product [Sphagnum tenellum]|uniref:Rieske domain-containing protein n=1 Tax=Sphagnum jensenii TaxID=128206 RepID=A0ABP1C3K2_9BRYO
MASPPSLCLSCRVSSSSMTSCSAAVSSRSGGEGFVHSNRIWTCLLRESHLEDPWVYVASKRGGGTYDVNLAWELLRQDVLYLDWKARHDVSAIVAAHDKVVEVLNPLVRDQKSVDTMRAELSSLQAELSKAHSQVHLSEARVAHTLQRLAELEMAVNDKLLEQKKTYRPVSAPNIMSPDQGVSSTCEEDLRASNSTADFSRRKYLDVSGPVGSYPAKFKDFWYPVAFSDDIDSRTMVPFESFEESWVIFRGKDGRPGCVRDACAHRACPLSLGKVEDGRIQCAYHGWEYGNTGRCEKMPSTRQVSATLETLPCIEQDGMVWIWPGSATPASTLPSLLPPANYTIHAQIVLELPVEHGLLVENLLDLAHAPFTHTTTFARGWKVPSFVKFRTPMAKLRGTWDPYPIAMEFQPPCMVLSTIGLEKPGKLDGSDVDACPTHLHQLHVCIPSSPGKTRLLYRMALDFAPFLKHVPFIQYLWQHLANKVLGEDLRLVEGQQNRMQRGSNVWNLPVAYDKLGVRYRQWRKAIETGEEQIPFTRD